MCIFGLSYAGSKSHIEYMELLKTTVPQAALNFQNEWMVKVGDYTGDGEDDMIAFVCIDYYSETEGGSEGTYYLYYCSNNRISVYDTIRGGFYNLPKILKVSNISLLYYTLGYGGPTGDSFCWKCSEEKLIPIVTPGELTLIGDNQFSCISSDFGSVLPDGDKYTIGRCWYTYYYFFNGSEFKEYAGKKITADEFSAIPGGKDILSTIQQNGMTIRSIFYRANGIININCSIRQEAQNQGESGRTAFYYLELVYRGGSLYVNGEWKEGNIQASLTPDLAVYP